MTRPWRAAAASAAAYVAVTAVLGREVLARLGSAIASDAGDPLFVATLFYWNATRMPFSEAWWQLPIFHPTRDALALSEHLLGLSVLSTPLYWITGDAIAAYNLVVLLTFPLCALAMYALVFRLTRSAAGAFLGGLAFAFSPYRVAQLPHVQVLASFFAPVALVGLHAYVETGRRRWLLLYAAAWVLQGAANGYALVFFTVIVGLWVAWFVVARRNWRALAAIAVATGIAVAPLVPILYRYVTVHDLYGFSRNAAEMREFSADLLALACAPSQLTFWGWLQVACRPEGQLFPGAAVVALGIAGFIRIVSLPAGDATRTSRWLTFVSRALLTIGLLYAAIALSVVVDGPWRIQLGPLRLSASSPAKPAMAAAAGCVLALALSPGIWRAARGSSTLGFYLAAALASWVLALGPTVTFMGEPRGYHAPFALLTFLPGVEGLRAPARFWLMASMCLAVAVGLLAAALLDRRRPAVLAGGLVIGTCALLSDGWVDRIPTAPVPPRIAGRAPAGNPPILHLPMGGTRDIAAGFRAITAGRRSVNGYSGYAPHYYYALADAARAEHDDALLPFLALGDLEVIVAADAPRLQALVERQAGAVRTAAAADGMHYRVPRRPNALAIRDVGERHRIQAVGASCEAAYVPLAADGDARTHWECGPQRPDHELVVDLGSEATVGAIVQDLGGYAPNFPREPSIETSVDRASWQPAWSGSIRGLLIAQALDRPSPGVRFAVPFTRRRARYVRLRPAAAPEPLAWSLAEIEVWSGGDDSRRHGHTTPAASCSPTDAVCGRSRPVEGGRLPNSLRIASSSGSIVAARLARRIRSQSGSNFFQPAAYPRWRSPARRSSCAEAPRAIERHR